MLAQFAFLWLIVVVKGNIEQCEFEKAQLNTRIAEMEMKSIRQLESESEIKSRFIALRRKHTILRTKFKRVRKEMKKLKMNHTKLQRECQCDTIIQTPGLSSMPENRTPETTIPTTSPRTTTASNKEPDSDRIASFGLVADVRLIGHGNTSGAGRVEIFYKGLWGTICHKGWDINDATVICRMLGFPNAIAALPRATFGPGSGPILLTGVECMGTESSIGECTSNPNEVYLCRHTLDASVVCNGSDESVRLAGDGHSANAGRVEIMYGGQWGTICHDAWDLNDANVICRMLGFSKATAAPPFSFYGPGSTETIWMDFVGCLGMESSISECKSDWWNTDFCSHYREASVVCDGFIEEIRLVSNWQKPNQGRVEILYAGEWGTICGYNWDINEANVICRMLGFSKATAAPTRAYFGRGSGFIWLDGVKCTGNESSIAECGSKGWGDHFCDHNEDASVICEP